MERALSQFPVSTSVEILVESNAHLVNLNVVHLCKSVDTEWTLPALRRLRLGNLKSSANGTQGGDLKMTTNADEQSFRVTNAPNIDNFSLVWKETQSGRPRGKRVGSLSFSIVERTVNDESGKFV